MTFDNNLSVRMGQKEDLDSLMLLAKEHLEELNIPLSNESLKYSYNLFSKAVSNDSAMIGVLGNIGDVFGYTILRISVNPCTEEAFLDESGMFLKKDKRSLVQKYHLHLIDFAKNASSSLGMRLRMNLYFDKCGERRGALMRLFEKQFGNPSYVSYMYDPHKASQN